MKNFSFPPFLKSKLRRIVCDTVVQIIALMFLVFYVKPYSNIVTASLLFIAYVALSLSVIWKAVKLFRVGHWFVCAILLFGGFIFWDWIPMEITYGYQCYNNAGLTVYKTVEQWKEDNPGVLEQLKAYPLGHQKSTKDLGYGYDGFLLNDRFAFSKHRKYSPFRVVENKKSIIDVKTDEVIAKHITFSTDIIADAAGGRKGAGAGHFKLWMSKGHSCAVAMAGNSSYIDENGLNRLVSNENDFWVILKTLTTGGNPK